MYYLILVLVFYFTLIYFQFLNSYPLLNPRNDFARTPHAHSQESRANSTSRWLRARLIRFAQVNEELSPMETYVEGPGGGGELQWRISSIKGPPLRYLNTFHYSCYTLAARFALVPSRVVSESEQV